MAVGAAGLIVGNFHMPFTFRSADPEKNAEAEQTVAGTVAAWRKNYRLNLSKGA
jgi:hypothetical protein